MIYNIILQPGAEDDIDDAYYWYEHQRSGLGEEFLDELIEYYEKLKHNPATFKWANKEYRQAGMHRFPYALVYKVIEAEVIIYAVFHTSRNPKHKFRH